VTPIRLDGRVALVTGAGRGLGAAHARALAARGGQVVVHDAGVAADGSGGDPSLADAVAAEIESAGGEAIATYENLESPEGCAAAVERALASFGRLDVVVQNAGLLVWEELEEADASWERMRRVNVDAPFHLARAALPWMKQNGYGRFVFTTSGRAMSVQDTRPGLAAYAVGKMAHFALMLVVAAEGRDHGIEANAIAPAAATRMLQRQVEPGELLPEHVSPAVVFLASDRCTFSGKVLECSGGRFSVARWESSPTVDLGRKPAAPEEIEARWRELEGAFA
jgi:NAD(P)-dependent dehydrogenase (short-subunit alcohol dehydrogenase family)